jgi:hypothetical protein
LLAGTKVQILTPEELPQAMYDKMAYNTRPLILYAAN